MKKRLCSSSSSSSGLSIIAVLLILIPLINSSTTAAGGAPNPMMNITEPLSMSSMSMSIEKSAGGDEVLLMMDSEINRMLASPRPGVNYRPLKTPPPCAQGRQTDPYNNCRPKADSRVIGCSQYSRRKNCVPK